MDSELAWRMGATTGKRRGNTPGDRVEEGSQVAWGRETANALSGCGGDRSLLLQREEESRRVALKHWWW